MCNMTHIRKNGADLVMTHSYVWLDSWLIHTCDVTHSYVWHDRFTCVPHTSKNGANLVVFSRTSVYIHQMHFICPDRQCVTIRYSVLQCVAVRCIVLQCVAAWCSVLQFALQRVAVWCNEMQHDVVSRSMSTHTRCISNILICSGLQYVEVCWMVLQCVAVCCSVMQCDAFCIAVRCSVMCSVLHCVYVQKMHFICPGRQCVAIYFSVM